jgi:hypothetical protein
MYSFSEDLSFVQQKKIHYCKIIGTQDKAICKVYGRSTSILD